MDLNRPARREPHGSALWKGHSVQALPATLANSFLIASRIASLIERAPVTIARRSTRSRSASLAAKPKVSVIEFAGFAGLVPGLRFVFMSRTINDYGNDFNMLLELSATVRCWSPMCEDA